VVRFFFLLDFAVANLAALSQEALGGFTRIYMLLEVERKYKLT
jgi:hypothetical protein